MHNWQYGAADGPMYGMYLAAYRTIYRANLLLGNAGDFGNLTVSRRALGGTSSATRGLMAGGLTPSLQDVIDYVTIASTADATDFGNLSVARHSCVGASNSIRGVFMGGMEPSTGVTIDYVTIASTGNAIDFGDLSAGHGRTGNAADSHGGLQSA